MQRWASRDACSEHAPISMGLPATIERIVRIARVVADLPCAESFYRAALGFTTVARGPVDSRTLAAIGAAHETASEVRLRLGDEEIALVQFTRPGRAYPAGGESDDLWFQHLAIVVHDMPAAYAALQACAHGWRAISRDGPQRLPPAAGSVEAFKFRDPDGHPLELLWFPPGSGRALWQERARGASPFLGIDHTALAVSSTPMSLEFYRALGMHPSASTLNEGPAQSRLDGLAAAHVQVTGLRPPCADGPGIELLDYRPGGHRGTCDVTDLCTDWIVAVVGPLTDSPVRLITDPDGHRLLLIDPAGYDRHLRTTDS